jgi:predicted DNA-binding protein with PD1-like motif
MHYSKCKLGYILRPEIGEEIQETLRQFAEKVGLKGAFFSGIGTLTQVELAFFRRDTKSYERRFFDDDYEMTALNGNLSFTDGVPSPHTHVSICDRNFATYSGHLVRGVVSLTAEILVMDVDLSLTRKEDPIMRYKGLISPQRIHLKIQN